MAEQRFRLVGDVDMVAAPDVIDDLHKVIDASGDDLLIDCVDLDFIDSSGIRVLIVDRNVLDGQGREMRIVNMPRTGRRAIDALALTEFLGVDGTDEIPRPT